jgi:hypothetical protein
MAPMPRVATNSTTKELEANSLMQQAARCSRLARDTGDEAVRAQLLGLAAGYKAKAATLQPRAGTKQGGRGVPYDSFQIAATRAVTSYLDEVWRTLSPSERSAAIYRELRKLDAESIKGPKPTPPGREDNEMNKAEETVKHAIRNAMTSTSGDTGLRAGAACDRLVLISP